MTTPDPQRHPDTVIRPEERAEPAVSLEDLSTTLYQQLKGRGVGMMKGERAGHTLTPTALVNEAVGRLLASDQRLFNNRAHLLAAAALAMRRVLIEHARARGRQRRGGQGAGGARKISWDSVVEAIARPSDPDTLLDLDDALERLRTSGEPTAERNAQLAVLRLFGAMTNEEIASVLGVGLSTVEKDWRYIKSCLQAMMAGAM